MLFKQSELVGITKGRITTFYRKWKQPGIKKGSLIKSSIGQLKVLEIKKVAKKSISESDAKSTGISSRKELIKILERFKVGDIYRIRIKYDSPDPRTKLRQKRRLTNDEILHITKKLDRMDKASKQGPWTRQVLNLIKENPQVRAADLAIKLKSDKDKLKINVRKLKNLGLTISHEMGYSISPMGKVFLKSIMK